MKQENRCVRIYRPAQTAMQSGMAGTKKWVIKFIPNERPEADFLMGWIGSGDTRTQLKLTFSTKEEAISYAESKKLLYEVIEPKLQAAKAKSYADNFSYQKQI